MAYLELSLEAYNDIIQAAGLKGSKVARVCAEQGHWCGQAADEAPPNVAQTDLFGRVVPENPFQPRVPHETDDTEDSEKPQLDPAYPPIIEAEDD